VVLVCEVVKADCQGWREMCCVASVVLHVLSCRGGRSSDWCAFCGESVVGAASAALAAFESQGTGWSTAAVVEGYMESARIPSCFGGCESV
jgi:hypothetical protein